MGNCTWCWYRGTAFLFYLGSLVWENSVTELPALSTTILSSLGFVIYFLSFLMVTLLLHGVFAPELAHPGVCHSSSEGKCPGLLAVKQCWVWSLFWSRLVFLLFLTNEPVNLNADGRGKLLFSGAPVPLSVTWPRGLCRVFGWHLPLAAAQLGQLAAANFRIVCLLFGL